MRSNRVSLSEVKSFVVNSKNQALLIKETGGSARFDTPLEACSGPFSVATQQNPVALDLEAYIRLHGEIPELDQGIELVHVMLKPDALECGLQEQVIQELQALGGILVFQKELRLSRKQVEEIYFDFTFDSAREYVFTYLANNETLHLAFIGDKGLHQVLNDAKGRTGGTVGLRGKYITRYKKLDKDAFDLWLHNKHPEQEEINAEMFCRNLLHVAPDADASKRDLTVLVCD